MYSWSCSIRQCPSLVSTFYEPRNNWVHVLFLANHLPHLSPFSFPSLLLPLSPTSISRPSHPPPSLAPLTHLHPSPLSFPSPLGPGYIVGSGVRRGNGAQGLRIVIQSAKDPEFLQKRVEVFLVQMRVGSLINPFPTILGVQVTLSLY